MSDHTPHKTTVETDSLRSGIAYAISVLGAIPLRYNQPRFPSIRRTAVSDTAERRLLAAGSGVMPPLFALSTFSTLSKPANPQGNQAVLHRSVNLGMNNGSRHRLRGAFMEVAFAANVYSESMPMLLQWVSSVLEEPVIKGRMEFADGPSLPVTVELATSIDWTDPILSDESASSILERRFSVSVMYKALLLAGRVETAPLYKATLLNVALEDDPSKYTVEIPTTDEDDWP